MNLKKEALTNARLQINTESVNFSFDKGRCDYICKRIRHEFYSGDDGTKTQSHL